MPPITLKRQWLHPFKVGQKDLAAEFLNIKRFLDDINSGFTSLDNLSIDSFTAGSIIFAGNSSALSQNNAKLFWDNTNNILLVSGPGDAVLKLDNTTIGPYKTLIDFTNTAGTVDQMFFGFTNSGINGGTAGIIVTDSSKTELVRFGSGGIVGIGINSVQGNGLLQVKAGAQTTNVAKVGGVIFDHFTNAGNATTTETDLYSDTLPASLFNVNGDKVAATYGGTFVSSGTATREMRAYFGGTLIFDSGALSISAGSDSWAIYVNVIRDSSTSVRCIVTMNTTGATTNAYCTYTAISGLTLTNTQILKITGQAAAVGAATNDIVAKLGSVEWKSAA